MSEPGCSEAHGGLNPRELAELGVSGADVIDFSVNTNPFGPSPQVVAALRTVNFTAYPDRACAELTSTLARANRVSYGETLPGNGASELIWLIGQAVLRPGDGVVILGPTFGEYRRAAEMLGAQVVEVRGSGPDFCPPVDALVEQIGRLHPRLVFVCNPNNPTGQVLTDAEIDRVRIACGDRSTLVIDEAYRAFHDGRFFSDGLRAGTIYLRSMTKDFAMAGVRLGYMLASSDLVGRMRALQPAWSVNAFAQAAGMAALEDLAWYADTLHRLTDLKRQFFADFRATGYEFVPSAVHYGLVDVGRPARVMREKLLRRGIQVRDCASFGLPDHLRLCTRLPQDTTRLIEALRNDFLET
jgi:histidinol-phosphate aminotransferase